jgi:hypothetical protein
MGGLQKSSEFGQEWLRKDAPAAPRAFPALKERFCIADCRVMKVPLDQQSALVPAVIPAYQQGAPLSFFL